MNALSVLSEEEQFFFETVSAFARERVKPRVAAMDERAQLDADLLPHLFELGVMGVELPSDHGGAGSSFFNAILAVEALAEVDPSVAVLVDVQNTLVNNALLRWGNAEQKARYLPKLAGSCVGMPVSCRLTRRVPHELS